MPVPSSTPSPESPGRHTAVGDSDPARPTDSQPGDDTLSGRTTPVEPASLVREGSRYAIHRQHAEGGLGVVFVARDGELGRTVALKEMKPGMSAGYAQEFQREGEITGNLEHPGIVPVYGLGTYADGRPFYAMRFIEGQNLDAAIKAYHANPTPVGFRQLLSRFVAVCNAIAYAHSRGIIHRDIKPANVMLGKFGETLVVDWGLAKTVGRGDVAADSATLHVGSFSASSTERGAVKGTPAFMSPEQADGLIEELDRASDIYSLGATLYALLTNQPPFRGSRPKEIVERVRLGQFVPPRQLFKSASPALSAVCCKAMSLRPEDRYESALGLASEVEKYLADEPVSAYREPFRARARRWMRKHPGMVSAVAAAVLVGGVCLGAGLLVVQGKNADLRTARDEADTRRTEAETARDLARGRFRLALAAYNDMVFGIQNKLENRPGTQDLRKDLLEKAGRGLQMLLREAENDGKADSTLMWSHLRMGDLLMTLGDTPGAEREYQTGCDKAAAFAADNPGDAKAQRELSVGLNHLGDVRIKTARVPEAVELYERCLGIREALLAADPKSADARLDVSVSLDRLGDARLRLRQGDEALKLYRRGLEMRETLAADNPKSRAMQRNLSVSLDRLGEMRARAGQPKEADVFFQRSLEIREKLAAENPNDPQARRDLSVSLTNLGDMRMKSWQFKAAIDLFQRGLTQSEKLAAEDPKNAEAQRDLTYALERLADAQTRTGLSKEPLELYRRCLGVREKLAADDPKSAQAQKDLVLSSYKVGSLEQDLARFDEAARSYQKGVDAVRRFGQPKFLEEETADLVLRIASCRTVPKLLEDPANVSSLPEPVRMHALSAAFPILLKDKAYPKARRAVDLLAGMCVKDDDFYNAACLYSRLMPIAPAEEREVVASKAFGTLRAAIARGFDNVAHLKSDADFEPIRERAEFRAIVAELEAKKK